MAVIEEGKNLGDLLNWELDRNYCRETVTVASGQNLKLGTVVGIVAATGFAKIVSVDPEEEDGSDTAVGVILEDATSGAKAAVIIARTAIVIADGVIFPAGAN
ncbi:MAG: head decoration protein, partial [Holosporaceae bacterium]|nr:head decoration protein [Holosporaceae bacterium]